MIPRRAAIALVLLFCLVVVLPQSAQNRKTPTGPRAVGVLEMTSRGMRLVPISLMIDGRYYDASLYLANPVPMAIESDTVYEVQRGGEAIGDFTISDAEQWSNGAWAGDGKWLSAEDKKKREEQVASAGAKSKKPDEEDEGPPKLRRGGNRPVEPPPPQKKPTDRAPEPAATPAPEPPKPQLQETVSDPNRPILKRGKPAEEQAQKLGNEKVKLKPPEKPPAGLKTLQVAVSDAKQTESRPYTWKWSSTEEEQKMHAKIEKLALAVVNDYAKKINGPTPGKLEDVDLRSFDLSYNNAPHMILSARVLPATPEAPAPRKGQKPAKPAPAPPVAPDSFVYYVTVVGREDIYTNLDKTFASVTDSKHLDAYPRMQLIDAVDADGNGNGDLLFRSISDTGSSFVLYNAVYAQLQEVLRVPEPKLQ